MLGKFFEFYYLQTTMEDKFLFQVIGKSHVAVPTHFFKVVLIETEKDGFELEAFLLPNQVCV